MPTGAEMTAARVLMSIPGWYMGAGSYPSAQGWEVLDVRSKDR